MFYFFPFSRILYIHLIIYLTNTLTKQNGCAEKTTPERISEQLLSPEMLEKSLDIVIKQEVTLTDSEEANTTHMEQQTDNQNTSIEVEVELEKATLQPIQMMMSFRFPEEKEKENEPDCTHQIV